MSKLVKTNAVRELERLKIPVSIVEYEVDEDDLSAVHAAESSSIPLERIYKTLVLRDCDHIKDLIVAGNRRAGLDGRRGLIVDRRYHHRLLVGLFVGLSGRLRGGLRRSA